MIETPTTGEFELIEKHGRWHSLRLQPYRTAENKVEGAVVILVDIDNVKRSGQSAGGGTEHRTAPGAA